MKFEREKDLPAFRNKTAKERRALRREAIRRDPAIMWVSALGGALMAIWLPISYRLVSWIAPELNLWLTLLVTLLVFAALSQPFYLAFWSLFITPRMRLALDSHAPNSA